MAEQLECRIVITQEANHFSLGMYDPKNGGRYVALGRHHNSDRDKVIRDLKTSIERAGHRLTFCERSAG